MSTVKPDYDQPLKWLAERDPDGFLRLVLKAPARWIRSRSPELPAKRRQADLVWEVEYPDGRRGLLHIELQTKADSLIEARITEYSLRLWMRDQLLVRSMVIFFRPTSALPGSPFNWSWNQTAGYGYPFEVIRLWELQPEELLQTDHYTLWPLAGVMGQEVSTESFEAVAEEIIHTPLPRQEVADLIGGLTAIGGLRLSREAITEALRRHPILDDLLRESSFKDVMADLLRPELEAELRPALEAQLRPALEAQLRPALEAQLRPELEAKGMREAIQGVLESRFGPLAEDMQAALGRADETALRALLPHLSTESLAEMRARLGLR